jgi:hypothetical protein
MVLLVSGFGEVEAASHLSSPPVTSHVATRTSTAQATAASALRLVLPAIATDGIRRPIYFWGNIAAAIRGPGQVPLPEAIRPSLILLYADGGWDIEHLHWTGWGSSVAHANGISSASNGNPSIAQGKRIKKPGYIILARPERFYGHEVYRCFTLFVHRHFSMHRCLSGRGGYWFFLGRS